MFKIDLIAVGKNKKGSWFDLQQDYLTRLHWPVVIHEIESKHTDPKLAQDQEQKIIGEKLSGSSYNIVLDERGKEFRSVDFTETLKILRNQGHEKLSFIIGGADGHCDSTRHKANMLLSFGRPTWPHMMVRVMLLEQLYRAQQIMVGHPYHREG